MRFTAAPPLHRHEAVLLGSPCNQQLSSASDPRDGSQRDGQDHRCTDQTHGGQGALSLHRRGVLERVNAYAEVDGPGMKKVQDRQSKCEPYHISFDPSVTPIGEDIDHLPLADRLLEALPVFGRVEVGVHLRKHAAQPYVGK